MEPSGSRAPPKKPSFETGTRVAVHSIVCHLCFFCGNTFPVLSDYQRHIVHEHQMASIAYQLYAEEHPPGKEGSLKRVKSEDKKKKNEKENGDEKRQKMDDSLNTQPSLPLPAPLPPTPSITQPPPLPITDTPTTFHPITFQPDRPYLFPVAVEEPTRSYPSKNPTAHHITPVASPAHPSKNPLARCIPSEASPSPSQPTRNPSSRYLPSEASPSPSPSQPYMNPFGHNLRSEPSSPLLPPGRYPANKQLSVKRSSLSSNKSSESETPHKDSPGELCAVCSERFSNGTSLVAHSVKDHNTKINDVEMFLEDGNERVPTKHKFTAICEVCDERTPTFTCSFEHFIMRHKGLVFRGTEANSATFVVKCSAPQVAREFNVNIRLKRSASART